MVLETEVELWRRGSEIEPEYQRTEAEPVGPRMKAEPGERWSQTEPKVQAVMGVLGPAAGGGGRGFSRLRGSDGPRGWRWRRGILTPR